MRVDRDFSFFDPYQGETLMASFFCWMEQLFSTDWLIDPKIQNYQLSFWDNSFAKGGLVSSWEFTSPGVYVLHVRPGIHWQNIAPASGREFVANDIVLHFDRMLGLGAGYTTPAPYWGGVAWCKSITSVTSPDKYTVIINWNTPNIEFVNENLEAPGASTSIENPEAVQQWGNLNDWHHAIGTGPFMITDYVSGSSMTLVSNPSYWGYDERYPKNKLPYIQKVNYLVIANVSTALAAMRSGKIDIIDSLTLNQAKPMKTTNPNIVQINVPHGNGITLDPRNDLAPFNDIRVRKAFQMAVNLPLIASSYYGGYADPTPLSLTSKYLVGWGYPYDQWPQSLKDEYAFNQTAAKQLLIAAGLTLPYKTDIVVDQTVDQDLLLLLQAEYADVGINMEIRSMDSPSFSAFVNSGHKNDALAQRPSGALGLTFYPIRHLLRFAVGQPANVAMVTGFDHFYTDALAATTVDQVKQTVLAANKDVAQQHYVISLLQPLDFDLCQPWIKGYNGQYGTTSGTNGPFFFWFYEARFWIDSSKK
jgi:peptide/nickel transport system substrate-binding protein